MIFLYLLVALVGAAVAVFAAQNLDPVVIRFLTWRIEGAPLALVIILSVVAGAFTASLVGGIKNLRLRSRIRQLERQLPARPGPPESPTSAMPPR
jgi:uncharacterized integral membrane protein